MTEFELIKATDAYTLVAVRGRLDPAGVGLIELRLTSETVARRKPAIVDVTAVNLIGSIGIGMLVGIGHAMKGHDLGFAVVASGLVKEILDKVSLNALFPVVETVDEAKGALGVS